jgi:hypothetical protein
MIVDLSLQPSARLIEHFVGQRGVVARASQDHCPNHRCPTADRRAAFLSASSAWGDVAEAFNLLF